MKKILFFFLLFNMAHLFAQEKLTCYFYSAGTHPVSIYHHSYSTKPFTYVQDDSINEDWSEITILKKRGSRFFVSIHNPSLSQDIKGWINKTECGVTLYPNERKHNKYYRFYKKVQIQNAG